MGFKLLDFYKISPPVSGGETDPERSVRFKRLRWATNWGLSVPAFFSYMPSVS